MTSRTTLLVPMLVMAFALLTWLLGWWGVALVAVTTGAFGHARDGRPWLTALSAALAWTVLLLANAMDGRFATLSSSLAGVMRIPAPALLVATVVFAALLAWSGAVVGGETGRLLAGGRASRS